MDLRTDEPDLGILKWWGQPNTTAKYHLPGTTAYTHDVNGNMKSRLNTSQPGNNITAISYNYNLP
jgi:hypothetical protein